MFKKIDIKKINWIEFTPNVQKIRAQLPERNFLPQIILYWIRFVSSFFKYPLGFKYKEEHYDVLFYGTSINNILALEPIYESLHCKKLFIKDSHDFPVWKVLMYSMSFFLDFLRVYYTSTQFEKKCIKKHVRDFWDIYGLYIMAEKVIKRYSPKFIVIANDHLAMQRCFLFASSRLGVKTIYTQHASVTEQFPKLQFDFSFLDGMETLEKYKLCGEITGNVVLIGGSRFDACNEYLEKADKKKQCIGVALNSEDDLLLVEELIDKIKSSLDYKIILRPHPQMNQAALKRMADRKDISFSNSLIDTSFVFLEKVDILVANESSIHLDAAVLRKRSVLYNFSDRETSDWYGYLANGLIKRAYSIDSLIEILQKDTIQFPPDDLIKYYNASYKASYEGNVSLEIAGIIDDLVQEKALENKLSLLESTSSYNIFSVK